MGRGRKPDHRKGKMARGEMAEENVWDPDPDAVAATMRAAQQAESSDDEEAPVVPQQRRVPMMPPSDSDEEEEAAPPQKKAQEKPEESSSEDDLADLDAMMRREPRSVKNAREEAQKEADHGRSKKELKEEMDRLAIVKKRREEQRLKRIKEEGWDRFAPITETNKPPGGDAALLTQQKGS
ncbi:unnamed protein product [Pedinophyceae sp. YPF-701]|nr:unnamed protein product [Pedinophyceae sp. YPF-701]